MTTSCIYDIHLIREENEKTNFAEHITTNKIYRFSNGLLVLPVKKKFYTFESRKELDAYLEETTPEGYISVVEICRERKTWSVAEIRNMLIRAENIDENKEIPKLAYSLLN